ncbi:cAMP-dependent protein kinase catalytic subunit alpha-like [Teleopsis dalmanni]|uniref:cAMP-dependent protein kinase catalytic subunit alpha-like n=1 Tax=Teleopsis dalmanni TaxID=139649 RepID=UPI0018CF658B|nr:cAMP-dependent protein kinase catalytic subunit alpha-like [Teleopsis dalmanni]
MSLTDMLVKAKVEFQRNWNENRAVPAKLSDFELIRTVGQGGFGRVIIVRQKTTDNYFVIKLMCKIKVVKLNQVAHTLNEKRVLQSTNFKFIVKLFYSFKDNSNLYLVQEYVPGGELFRQLRKLRRFSEDMTRFYSSQVILAIEYLHFMDVVYRDVKPENIVLDAYGFVKLTDFGFAKYTKRRTYTLCGTPEYLAPEILQARGYGKAVDWWSIGVFIYELIAGFTPFYAPEHLDIYARILSGKIEFNSHFSQGLEDLLINLLQIDITKRFGNQKNGVRDIKHHFWFNSLNWSDIYEQKVKPPYIPIFTAPNDTRNFELGEEHPIRITQDELFPKEFEDF